MACDLWGPSSNQVAQESSWYTNSGSGWQSDFSFDYGFDVIEERALNEKSCVQVLRILITEADVEIDELERDLTLLQSELAWDEHEEWYEICCSSLKEKIDCLNISIRTLRNTSANDTEVHFCMHAEPADRLHEILKSLLRKYYLEREKQLADPTVKESGSHTLELAAAAGHSIESKLLSNLDSESIRKQEHKGCDLTPEDKKVVQRSSLTSAERRGRNPELFNIQPAEAVKCSCTYSLEDAVHLKMKSPYASTPKIASEKVEERSSLSMEDGIASGSSLKPDGKRVGFDKRCKPSKNLISEDSFHGSGLHMIKSNSASGLDAVTHTKIGDCDVDQKLCDIASRKRSIKELKVAANNNNYPSNSSTKTGGKRKIPPQTLEVGEVVLGNTENSALSSILELQDKKREVDTTNIEPKGDENRQTEKVQMSGSPNDAEKFNFNPSLKLKKQKTKKNIESNSPSIEETSFSSGETVSSSSSTSEAKKQLKSGVGSDNACITQSSKGGQTEARDSNNSSTDSEISVSVSQKKSNGQPTDNGSEAISLKTECYRTDYSGAEIVTSLPSIPVNLDGLTLRDLKVLARQNKVKNYSKLSKVLLAERLLHRLGCC